MKLEALTPLDRLRYVASTCSRGQPLDRFCVLSSTIVEDEHQQVEPGLEMVNLLTPVAILEAFATVIADQLRGSGQVYWLGDDNFAAFAESMGVFPECSWAAHLEVLANCGLIFRFPAALKFGYSGPLITQLRSNSWGNAAFAECNLSTYPAYETARNGIAVILERSREQYVELVALCQAPGRPLETHRIHALNSRLPIAIVT